MQTFLPYEHFTSSARSLDRARLGKQRVEAKQILMCLTGQSTGWSSHPAVRMWEGHEALLCTYGMHMSGEWMNRGYKDTLHPWFKALYDELAFDGSEQDMPWWLGHEPFHFSHRSNLVRKAPDHYVPMFGDIATDIPYFWPTKEQHVRP